METRSDSDAPLAPPIVSSSATIKRSLMQGHPLHTKGQFRSAQHVRIGDVIESIAQDRVHELVDEQGRHTGRPFAAESDVSRFQHLVAQEVVAERDEQSPVPARICILNGCDRRGTNWAARIGEQCAVQRALGRTASRWRRQFWQVDLEKLVGHSQPAAPSSRSSR
jgi:hypothetical protein